MDSPEVERTLTDRRSRLVAEMERLTRPPEAGSNLAFGKRIGEGTTEAVERLSTTAAARSIASSIQEIDRALQKLREGTYGRCDVCEEAITAARLEAKPAAARCVNHA